ncbi:hypothetical protein [Fodinibius salicampi]|nr:hypothetical protein [Fodinibius salicampi]
MLEDPLNEVGEKVFSTITNNIGPRFYGYITGGGNQVAVQLRIWQ